MKIPFFLVLTRTCAQIPLANFHFFAGARAQMHFSNVRVSEGEICTPAETCALKKAMT